MIECKELHSERFIELSLDGAKGRRVYRVMTPSPAVAIDHPDLPPPGVAWGLSRPQLLAKKAKAQPVKNQVYCEVTIDYDDKVRQPTQPDHLPGEIQQRQSYRTRTKLVRYDMDGNPINFGKGRRIREPVLVTKIDCWYGFYAEWRRAVENTIRRVNRTVFLDGETDHWLCDGIVAEKLSNYRGSSGWYDGLWHAEFTMLYSYASSGWQIEEYDEERTISVGEVGNEYVTYQRVGSASLKLVYKREEFGKIWPTSI